jgi:uncharacterized protein (DUF1697 family)
LRGINVSGHKLIKMEALRQHFEAPGIKNIVTYIQSGNVLFDTLETEESLLREKVEKQLSAKLGYPVPAIVRSLDNIKSVIANNPFGEADDDGRKIYVTFLSAPPAPALHQLLDNYKGGAEELKIINREVYLLLSNYGNTKLTNSLVEKKLGVAATTRNWATINKILLM